MVTILAIGDVFIDRLGTGFRNPFQKVQTVLRTGDIIFGNCEGVYANDVDTSPNVKLPMIADPRNADMLAAANIHIMSLANNHAIDGGHRGLSCTMSKLSELGIQTVGAGADILQATRHRIVETQGKRVAFLAYTCMFPYGYEARKHVPGVGPLRAYNLYVPLDPNGWCPGLQPQVVTALDDEDSTRIVESINEARSQSDFVVVSVHWGDYTRPIVLTEHEKQTARFLIDEGADLILGHHHHCLRGIEFYNEKPIFYGLGHFVFDVPHVLDKLNKESGTAENDHDAGIHERFGDYGMWPREGYTLLPFHQDSRLTMIAVAQFSGTCISIGVIPCVIRPTGETEALDIYSSEGTHVLDYLSKCCSSQNLSVRFDSGNPIVIDGIRAIRIVG